MTFSCYSYQVIRNFIKKTVCVCGGGGGGEGRGLEPPKPPFVNALASIVTFVDTPLNTKIFPSVASAE